MIAWTAFALWAAALTSVSFPLHASGAALHELDQIYYGSWVDSTNGDTPAKYNSRLGLNASAFHIAQEMPLPPYNYTTGAGGAAPEYLIELTNTSAAVLLTVYPSSLTNLTDEDYTTLANQVLAYKSDYNRSVFVRWGPEMQGTWNVYGQQPVDFVSTWKTMYTAVKAIAPDAAIVWAPNMGSGYPYGETTGISTANLNALDTNGDGQLTSADDPYSPYYPGDNYVDWIGLSIYYKQDNVNENVAQAGGFCSDVFNGINPATGTATNFSWYDTYCTKTDKACMIAESGAAYHPQDTGSATQLEIARAWWQDCLTNATAMSLFPRIKFTMHFEYEKEETDSGTTDLRDYRLTNATDILSAFRSDLASVSSSYTWATYSTVSASVATQGPGVSAPATATSTKSTVTLVMQTVRNPIVTGPPTLFGTTSDGLAMAVPWLASLVGAFAGGTWLAGRREEA